MPKYTVIVVEDDLTILARFSALIAAQEDLALLAIASTKQEGINALLLHKPDILLTDIGLPDGSGIDIIKAINREKLDCEAMVISGFQDEHIVFRALEAGAKSYILKHDDEVIITDAIHSMMKGGAPMSPIIARLMLQKFQSHSQNNALPEALTDRQVSILKLISQGFSSREISEKLDITYYTVTTHIKNIYTKLQVNSRTEALHEALKLGLIQL
ncbi:response regulator transcription factor [Paraglaciecola sp. L3A3]|uniref:LuxR C-terminal-related transcriptional regulator n=1 Tax=Paraglaciecola sp. L3A3 TaxID=2686358 RepID=UPI00131B59A0|nr:response regulator transcription factor [Paraglaciecola sp. L3A3]